MASVTPDHDIKDGPVDRCQVCGSSNLELVVDLGHQPLCDSLLSSSQLNEPEKFYPLRQVWCRDCTLSQLDYVVPGSEVYYPDYPYRPGITKELVAYQEQFAKEVSKELSLQQGDHVVDIGSNDGTLLTGFKKQGMKVTGIEPTNVAKIAIDSGIETLQRFFDEAAAREIVDLNGQAKLVTATNVFAHMSTLGAFLRGLEVLLSDGGVFVLENHYLLDIMDGVQFDSIYHEHLRSYSLKSICTLFDYYDFTVTDVKRVSRYGGNIRVYVTRGRGKTVKPSVGELLRKEEEAGLSRPEFYQNFKHKVDSAAFGLLKLAIDCKQKGESFVGNSCPGRCSTLLNYAGIGRELMPYIAEQPTSLKLGLHLPGKHMPIVNNQILIDEQPDYVVLLAWHYWKPISEQLRARGLKSKLIVPLPEVNVLT